jgi:mono/diheme cytochrome c family protein
MRHRLAAAAVIGLTALGACREHPFPPNVAPPKAADTARLVKLTASSLGQPRPPAEAGRAYVEAHCSSCHAVGDLGASPNPQAPPFRLVVTRYPPGDLAEAFSEGIVVGHPKMPPFVMSAEEADDVIAYLKTLAR